MEKYQPVSLQRVIAEKENFRSGEPFPFLVMDNFVEAEVANKLATEFPKVHDKRLFIYDNPLEVKRALNDWNAYPPYTYAFFQYLNSPEVINTFSEMIGVQLYPDHGLHGGGWHIHGNGGKLNPHLDYSIHPKMGLQRKLNLIIYLSKDWVPDWGGHLGFWSHDEETNAPRKLIQETSVKFNRAVLFDTTLNSWHGITRQVNSPNGTTRNSLAIYYLAEPAIGASPRSRALYAPTEDQKDDNEIQDLIKKRADLEKSKGTYAQLKDKG
ncbi:MAG: 2OG-Fe(II) oxygenase [Oceanospirillaceae bacterium]|nr:2OG-Fe(II) oxygenase [Oceanospirillaceae bacterium]